jgi:CRISPR-associated endonuclease Csn1
MARILGLDIGIGSCGWAVVDMPEVDPDTGEVAGEFAIVACGARCFDVPEEPKTKELKNRKRRMFRGQRRVARRRRQRLAAVRRTLARHGVPAGPFVDPPGTPRGHVWQLRAAALDRPLRADELARVILHIAKHRGFKSNSKRDRDNKSDAGKMLQAIAATGQRLAGWRSFGEMMACDPAFADRKRNRPDEYTHTPLRDDLEAELHRIFAAQRRVGAGLASEAREREVVAEAFFQRPLKESLELIGACRFERGEKRAPRHTPSFERFRFLSRLNNVKVCPPGERPRFLTAEERARAHGLVASQKAVTFKTLRRALALAPGTAFDGLSARKGDPEAVDFARFEGSVALREQLGAERFHRLMEEKPQLLDDCVAALVLLDDVERIGARLERAGADHALVERLTSDAALGAFSRFRGTGHISAKACRRLLPHLEKGLVYSEACAKVGYDHSAIGLSRVKDVRNPVVQKVLRECTKQIAAVMQEYGTPDLVHLEMARDVGKSPEERNEIRDANRERAAERERSRAEFLDKLGQEPNDEELVRFELWKEQLHRCPYTASTEANSYIPMQWLLATDNRVQVDHILPYSWSADDSYRNKVLCLTSANQQKRRMTPWRWFGESDPERWRRFEAHVETLKGHMHHQKRRKLLAKGFEDETRRSAYAARNLNDTRHAMRVLRHELELAFPTLGKRPLRTRPGAVTAMVRKAWGLNDLKLGGELGDRDHALDALVVACTSESLLNRLTRLHQRMEEVGSGRATPLVETPLGIDPAARERFRQMMADAARAVFVSRPEVRRGRGPAHDATLYGFDRDAQGREVQYQRVHVKTLTLAHLKRLKGDAARTRPLREVLTAWLERAAALKVKPDKLYATEPPRMPCRSGAGPVIRTVRLARESSKSGIKISRGNGMAHADLDSMVRVDVFRGKGSYFLVPIYANQVADRRVHSKPPNLAIKSGVGEENWWSIDAGFEFCFSLYSGSLVEALRSDSQGKVVERHLGYFRGADRTNGRITYSSPENYDSTAQDRFTTRTLSSFRKYHVDRLGRRVAIEREPRLWRGEVCS